MTLLGLAMVIAAFPFVRWVLLPSLALGGASFDSTTLLLRRAWTGAGVGAALACVGALATLLTTPATGPSFGPLAAVPLGLIGALGATTGLSHVLGPTPRLLRAGMVLGGATCAALALDSRVAAAASATSIAVAMQWLHLFAALVWGGGLLHLAVASHASRASGPRIESELMAHFAPLSALALGALLFSGVYLAWLTVGSLAALTGTAHGRIVLLKLGLLLPLLALHGGRWLATPRWRWAAVVEAVLAGGLLVASGTLGDLPSGRAIAGGMRHAAPAPAEGALILGVELLVLGVAAFGYVYWVAPRDRSRVPIPLAIAVAALAIGSLVAGGGAEALRTGAYTVNPIPPGPASIERGAALYADACLACHGEDGRGDGPAAAGLRPPPADFRVHLAAGHTDAQLFDWLTNGVPGTAMRGYRAELTDEERWHLLNYLRRAFGGGA